MTGEALMTKFTEALMEEGKKLAREQDLILSLAFNRRDGMNKKIIHIFDGILTAGDLLLGSHFYFRATLKPSPDGQASDYFVFENKDTKFVIYSDRVHFRMNEFHPVITSLFIDAIYLTGSMT